MPKLYYCFSVAEYYPAYTSVITHSIICIFISVSYAITLFIVLPVIIYYFS